MCFGWARYRGTENSRLVTADFRFSSTLALVNVTEDDEDQWVCMASNQKSQDYKVFNLDVCLQSAKLFESTKYRSQKNIYIYICICIITIMFCLAP